MQPILKVNLNSGEIDKYDIPQDWARDYLGAAPLAARILYDHLTLEIAPLSPEASLLFLTGPLTGTSGPAVGRFVVCGRSPATGLWGEANCGGFWSTDLRKAGYDGVWLTGKAQEPVYLWIQDDEVTLRSAEHLWGLDTYETIQAVEDELEQKGVRAAVIGPAGEAEIPFAIIMCDHGRAAGRTGMGAVMGSKNLKAIAVKGRGVIPVADPEEYHKLRSQANRDLRTDTFTAALNSLGSANGAEYFDYLGEMPKRYFQRGEFEGVSKVSGSAFAETILTGKSACHACVIACGRRVTLSEGEERKGPEYETIVGFGPNLWIDDKSAITLLGELCDEYGMDVISLSNIIGLSFMLYEQGVITLEDTGGLALEWGSVEAATQLVHLTAKKEGIGEYLALGALGMARHFGDEGAAVQVNGLEVPYHDPRGFSGMALVYATSPRGACHNQSEYFLVEMGLTEESLGIEFFDSKAGAEKSANVALHQDWDAFRNALVICTFANLPPAVILDLVNAACGYDLQFEDMMKYGERGWNLKRVINNRLGLTRSDDRLPRQLLEPYTDGGSAGFVPDLEGMLAAYYEARGWDPQTGFPTQEKLSDLGLGWAAGDLWPES